MVAQAATAVDAAPHVGFFSPAVNDSNPTPAFSEVMNASGGLVNLEGDTKRALSKVNSESLATMHNAVSSGEKTNAFFDARNARDDLVQNLGRAIDKTFGSGFKEDWNLDSNMRRILGAALHTGAEAMANASGQSWEAQVAAFDKAMVGVINAELTRASSSKTYDISVDDLNNLLGKNAKQFLLNFSTGDRNRGLTKSLGKFTEAAAKNGDVIQHDTWEKADAAFDQSSGLHGADEMTKMFLANINENMLQDVISATMMREKNGEYANYNNIREDIVAQTVTELSKLNPTLGSLGHDKLTDMVNDAFDEAARVINDVEDGHIPIFLQTFAADLSKNTQVNISAENMQTIMGDSATRFMAMYELGDENKVAKGSFFGGVARTFTSFFNDLFSGNLGRTASAIARGVAAVSTGGMSVAAEAVANGVSAETGSGALATIAQVGSAALTGGASLASVATTAAKVGVSHAARELLGDDIGGFVGNVAGAAIGGGDIGKAAISGATQVAIRAIT